jgi:hypothetical protein
MSLAAGSMGSCRPTKFPPMVEHRVTPFELVFESAASTSFPAVREALAQEGGDARDRDVFLMVREALLLLRELRPDEGLGEGIDQLTALVHHAYLFWESGSVTVEVPSERLHFIMGQTPAAHGQTGPRAEYVQLPERRIWAQVVPGEPQEPLDGFFCYAALEPEQLRILGVFGIYSDRPGFSVVEVAGSRPLSLFRSDGSPLFSSTLPGGAAAGLYSLVGEEELLELAWRVVELGAASWEPAAGSELSTPGT